MSKLYRLKSDPGHEHWIARDSAGVLVTWPDRPKGWSQRVGFTGDERKLEEVPVSSARGTGWPGAGLGRKPKVPGESLRPVTIRITASEHERWTAAAAQERGSLSDWIRRLANAETRIGRSRRSP